MRDDETLAAVIAAGAIGFLLARNPRAIIAVLHALGSGRESGVKEPVHPVAPRPEMEDAAANPASKP